jgi:uncharacterized membrane protein (DUF373 family)
MPARCGSSVGSVRLVSGGRGKQGALVCRVAREETSGRATADQRRDDQPSDELRLGNRLLHLAEDIINAGIAILLVAGGILLLFEAARTGVTGVGEDIAPAMIEMLDTLLLVFIFAELLFAVRVIITERTIIAEPFLLVGIIASIKEIVVLSVKAAELLGGRPAIREGDDRGRHSRRVGRPARRRNTGAATQGT